MSKIDQMRQNLYDAQEKLYKMYGRMDKPAEEATNARLAPVSIEEWVIFLRTKRKEHRLWKYLTVVQSEITCKPITCYLNL